MDHKAEEDMGEKNSRGRKLEESQVEKGLEVGEETKEDIGAVRISDLIVYEVEVEAVDARMKEL